MQLSLWDILTSLISGLIIIIIIDYFSLDFNLSCKFSDYEIIEGVYYLIIIYSIGLIYEPISNFIFKYTTKLYNKIFLKKKLESLESEEEF